jgi:Secretion system C-terminal sorting domain/Ig-like domain CHU_C associated/GEVED domain
LIHSQINIALQIEQIKYNIMKQIFTLLAFLSIATTTLATTRFVKPTASGTGDGSSWANAADTLNGILLASQSGDEVWVAVGTYKPAADWMGNDAPTDPREKTFYVPTGVTIRGGFVGTETSSNQYIITNHSILSGDIGVANNKADNVYHIISSASADLNTGGIGIVGFEIVDANNDKPNGSTITVNGYTMPHNYGAGIFIHGGYNTIHNNIIKNNTSNYAAGIYLVNTQGNILKNMFINDSAYHHTATIFADSSNDLYIRCNVYYGNYSDTAVLTLTNNGYVEIQTSIFALNKGGTGGCALEMVNNADPRIFASQFTSNSLIPGVAPGSAPTELHTVNNTCAVWFSAFQMPDTNIYLQGLNIISPCIFQAQALLLDINNVYGADGILYTADDGLQLLPTSPLIDFGVIINTGLPTDILEQPRIFKVAADVSPYENSDRALVNVYVDLNATGLNNGSSWANAYTNLDSALLTQKENVYVAEGIYRPSICKNLNDTTCPFSKKSFLVSNYRVFGSFPTGGNGPANIKLHPTILEGMDTAGNQVEHVLIVSAGVNYWGPSEIRNCIIQNGKATTNTYDTIPWFGGKDKIINNNAGAAVHCHEGVLLESCIIRNNFSGFGNIYGVNTGTGGSSFPPSDYGIIYLQHNEIVHNTANLSGGVIYSAYDLYSLGNLYAYNLTNQVLFSTQEQATIYSSPTFSTYMNVATTKFTNDIFYGNISKKLNNNYLLHSVATDSSLERQMFVTNCLFTKNVSGNKFGGSEAGNVMIKTSGTKKKVQVANSIFIKNEQEYINQLGISTYSPSGDMQYGVGPAYYSRLGSDTNAFNIYNCYLSKSDSSKYGSGNYNRNNIYNIDTPAFVNEAVVKGADSCFGTADDGYILKPTSSLINKGINSTAMSNIDAKSEARISGTGVDIGPYELQVSCQPIITYTPNCIGHANTINAMHNQEADSTIWFADSLMTIPLDTGYNLTTQVLSVTTDFWLLIKGCYTTPQKVTVNVVPHLDPIITISTAALHCMNGTDTLTASGANVYNWYGYGTSNPLIITSIQNTTTYTVFAADADGCMSSTTLLRIADSLPNVQAHCNKTFVCEGDSILLYGTNAQSYTWQNGIIDSVKFKSTHGPKTYTVIGVDAIGCSNMSTLSIAIKKNQNIQINVSNSNFCNTNDISINVIDTQYNTVPVRFDTTYASPLLSTLISSNSNIIRDSIIVSGLNGVLQKKEDLKLSFTLNVRAFNTSIILTAPSGKSAAIYDYSQSNLYLPNMLRYFGYYDTITINQFGPNTFLPGPNYYTYPTGTYFPEFNGTVDLNVMDSFINEPLNGKWYVDVFSQSQYTAAIQLHHLGLTLPNRIANNIQISPFINNLSTSTLYKDTISTNNLIPPLGTTIYTVTSSNNIGCSTTSTFTIQNNVPDLQVTYATFCQGDDSIKIKATGAYNYFWPNGTQFGANAITDTAVFITPDTGAIYTITATNAFNQCTATKTISPLPSFPPSITAILNLSPVACGNNAVQLKAISITPNTTVQWATSATAGLFATGMQVNYTPPFTSTIFANALDTITGCTSTPIPFLVNTLPTAPAPIIYAPAKICDSSGIANLQADSTNCSFINWYDSANNLLHTGKNYSPIISTTQTFYASVKGKPDSVLLPAQTSTLTNAGGRGYYFVAPKDFIITSLYIPTTASTANQNIAVVKFNNLSVIPPSNSATNSFTTLYLTQNNTSSGKITVCIPIKAGDSIGIIGSRGTMHSYSNLSTVSQRTFYIDSMPMVIDKLATNVSISTGPITDLWTGGLPNIGRINFDYITNSGCESPRTAVLVKVGNPVLNITALSNPCCVGAQNQLTVTGAATYVWNQNINTFGVFNFNGIDSIFTVTGTDASGCTATNSITINTIPPPVLDLSTSTDTICQGQTATLIAIPPNSNTSVTWFDAPNGNAITQNLFLNYSGTADTNFYIKATDFGIGCGTGFIQVPVKVKETPTLNLNGPNNVLCPGSSFSIFHAGPKYIYIEDSSASPSIANVNCSYSSFSNTFYYIPGTQAVYLDSATLNNATYFNTDTASVKNETTNGVLTSLYIDSTYTLTMYGDANKHYSAFIDFNGDGNFLGANDIKINGTTKTGGVNTFTFTVSHFAKIDYAVMRLFVADSNVFGTGPCNGSGGYGFVQIRDVLLQVKRKVAKAPIWNAPLGYSVYDSSSIDYYNGLPAGIYTFTASQTSNLGCISNDTVSVTVQAALPISILSKPNVCDGNSVALIAGGVGIDSLSVLWADDFDFNNANNYFANGDTIAPDTTITYYVQANDTNNCDAIDSIKFTFVPNPTVSANASQNILCKNTSTVLFGTGAQTYTWSNNILDSIYFKPDTTNTYTVIGADANGCTNSSIIQIQIASTEGSNLAQTTINNSVSTTGTQTMMQVQPDGTALQYTDALCNLICAVDDGNGGNTLGNTISTVTVEDSSIVSNSALFTKRHFEITPTNNGAATITLYITQADFDEYNADPLSILDLPLSGNNADANIANIRVHKIDGTLGIDPPTIITPTVTYMPSENYWKLEFPVTGFSKFYITTSNSAPLAIGITLEGKTITTTNNVVVNQLAWTAVNSATNYEVQKWNGNAFTSIANTTITNYDDEKISEENIYRIKADLMNGASVFSNAIKLNTNVTNAISIYPNPNNGIFNVAITSTKATTATIKIMDASGRIVRQIETALEKGKNKQVVDVSELANGVYGVEVIMENRKYVSRVTKQ